MIMKINKIGNLFLFIIFTACKSSFCSIEKKILYTNPDSPARVLKISDKKDSLLLRKPSKDVRKIEKNKDLEQLVKKLYLTMLEENGIRVSFLILRNLYVSKRTVAYRFLINMELLDVIHGLKLNILTKTRKKSLINF